MIKKRNSHRLSTATLDIPPNTTCQLFGLTYRPRVPCCLMSFDYSSRLRPRVTFPSMKLLLTQQSRWDCADHCPKHCYLLLLMTSVEMLLTLADQLVPSETGVSRKSVRKQIAKFNGMDWGKHQDTLISASFARFFACFRKTKASIRGLASCLSIQSAVAVAARPSTVGFY